MNDYVLICHGLAGGGDPGPIGQYLKWYDPEAFDGRGEAEWTLTLSEAARFASFTEAMEHWRQVPKARPLRPDGKPNRPLCAFSVEPRQVPRGTSEGVSDG